MTLPSTPLSLEQIPPSLVWVEALPSLLSFSSVFPWLLQFRSTCLCPPSMWPAGFCPGPFALAVPTVWDTLPLNYLLICSSSSFTQHHLLGCPSQITQFQNTPLYAPWKRHYLFSLKLFVTFLFQILCWEGGMFASFMCAHHLAHSRCSINILICGMNEWELFLVHYMGLAG